ncbi:oxygenase MpaB family protein [Actinocorallia longicatena]|uniref:Oxygenase MpaB family protein n=1 Tax=Actinocorallia longicatena TaxID=111803 RepID=A0ABP6QTM0_9ACTN
MSDSGLFEDQDVIRRVGREGILIAAGGVASILQTSHPGVGQGVHDHSYTFRDPVKRLRHTMEWLYAVQFGTREEAELVSAYANRMHASVNGPGYDALDHDLQIWVGATLFDVALRFHQALFGRLADHEVEEFYQQSRVYAQILGVPAERQPKDFDEFRTYYQHQLDTLQITEACRSVATQVLHPRAAWYERPALAAVRLLTAGLMPARLRAQYGWEWSRARRRRFLVLVNVLRLVYPRLPLRIRTAPRDHYLSTIRHRLRKYGT